MFGIVFIILSIWAIIDCTGRNNMNRATREIKKRLPQDNPMNITYINNRGRQLLVSNNHPCVWIQHGRYLKDLTTNKIVFDRYAKDDVIYKRLFKARLLYDCNSNYKYVDSPSKGAPWVYPNWGTDTYFNLIHMGAVYSCNKGYLNYKKDKIIMPHQRGYRFSITKSDLNIFDDLKKYNNELSALRNKYSYLSTDKINSIINNDFGFECRHCNDLCLPERKYTCDGITYYPPSLLPKLDDVETYKYLFEGGKDIYE